MSYFPFLGASFDGRSASFDGQRAINCYIEPSESGSSRSPAMLIGTPGLKLWAEIGAGPIRGVLRFTAGVSIVISGFEVWRVTSDKTATMLGFVVNTGKPVSMATNGTVIMMVQGAQGYFIDPTAGTVELIVNENFTGADRVDFIDGYFIWNKPGTGQFQISGLYSTSIDGLDFATAEGGPDNIVSLIVDHREVWLLGENTSEVWANTGDPDFPFQRIQAAFLEVGCAAPLSVAKADNSIYWLAVDDRGFGTMQRAEGYAPRRVSNHAFEHAVGEYIKAGTVADAVTYTYSQEGHTFVVITFPTANATWCLDASTNLWHERAYMDPLTGDLQRHRSNCQMQFANRTLVGDWKNGRIYELDLDTFTDNGDLLPLIRIAPHVASTGNRILFHSLELMMQTGVGNVTGEGVDPKAMLQWSNDGGYSWSSERWQSFGKVGERRTRVKWDRLGQARDRVFKVTITDPVRRVFTSCDLKTTECAA